MKRRRDDAQVVPVVTRAGATLHFATTLRDAVRVARFDARGRRVRDLLDDRDMAPGLHSLNFDGRDDLGDRLASWMYFHRVQAVGRSAAGKLLLTR